MHETTTSESLPGVVGGGGYVASVSMTSQEGTARAHGRVDLPPRNTRDIKTSDGSTYRVGTQMVRTTAAFDSYWHFARARHDLHQRRVSGEPAPWTDDEALRTFRFTNSFRVLDRVSQELLRRQRQGAGAAHEVLFRTLLFRCFNKSETFEVLAASLGHVPSWDFFDTSCYDEILGKHLNSGNRLYNAAYIIPAPPFGFARKHRNHLALIEHVMMGEAADAIINARSLRELYPILLSLPGLGPFLAFQLAIDLGYAQPWALDEADYVVAGPGAASGIRKCFQDTAGLTPAQIIHWMTDTQTEHFAARELEPVTLQGRRLQPIDCQNLFCETDKYSRVMHPDIQGIGARLRIKQRFKSCGPLPPPILPEHWTHSSS